MDKRVKSKGFEAAFIESYSGWDLGDVTSFQFYDCEMSPAFFEREGVKHLSCVEIDLKSMKLNSYDEMGNITLSCDIQLSLK